MSTPRSFVWLFAAVLIGAACSPSADEPTTQTSLSSLARSSNEVSSKRNRRPALHKASIAVVALLLVLSACSGDEESVENPSTTSSTAPNPSPQTTVDSTDPPPPPSATTTTTTTNAPAPAFAGIGETVLVAADDGVYQIDPEGDVELLVAGPVAYAVDDTRGGLLFQIDRARGWDNGHRSPTIVWWIPRGSSRPQELLVPTPGTDHSLSLHDTYATDDGFAALYVRHEGLIGSVEMIDRLRRFDVPAREVTELYSQEAAEQGFGDVSTNGELIAGVWYQRPGSGCFIYYLDGQPTDLVPSVRSDLDLTSDDYVGGCRLSPDGNRLVFETDQYEENTLASTTLHVWDLVADTEATRFVIPGRAGVADVSVTKLMATVPDDDGLQTLVFNLSDPEADPIPLPIAGTARFVDTPVHVGAGPHYYRYGDDGLFQVIGGAEIQLDAEPVGEAHDDLLGGVLYRYGWKLERPGTFWLPNGASEPVRVEPSYDFYFTAVYDGSPSLFFPGPNPVAPDADYESCLIVRDLVAGSETAVLCDVGVAGQDGGWSVRSFGGGRFAAVSWMAIGGMGSDRQIGFWDSSGGRIDLTTNPVPESCEPCTMSAHLSDDGSLLAYSYWPTAFWTFSTSSSEVDSDYESWRWTADGIPTVLVVVDLTTGDQLWTMSAEPWTRIVDFDGRFVVVEKGGWIESETGSVIYDTWGIHDSVEVDGGVALIRQSVTDAAEITLGPDGLGVTSLGDPVDDVLNTMTSLLGPPYSEEFVDPFAEQVALPYGFAADRYFRLSRWDHIGLYLVFSDSNYFRDDGEPHFVGWGVTQPGLQTESGIGVGSTATELIAAYGEAVALPDSFLDECGQGWAFRIAPPDPPEIPDYHASMRGELDGDPQDPPTRVTGLRGGADSDC